MQTDLDAQKVPATGADRRRHPRYRLSVPLTIRSADGGLMRGISIEISASGISAIAADSLKVNDTVELEPIAAVKVLATVRHNVGKIYGFEFLNLTAEQTQQITESCKLLPRYQSKSLGI
jgi:PilZ domain